MRMIRKMVVAGLLACACLHAWAGLPETPRLEQITVADGLPSNMVNDLAEDADGYLWLATMDGLARYDGVGFRTWRTGSGLRENMIIAVHVDAGNRIWLGTHGAGLAMLDTDRETFRYFDSKSQPLITSDIVWSITSTADGDLWFGTQAGGLYRMDAAGALTRYVPVEGDPRSVPGLAITALQVTADGSLWVGTDQGAARWTGKDFERLPAAALSTEYVTDIVGDREGNVWFSTALGGTRYRPDGSWTRDPWQQRARQVVYGVLLQDRQGSYWVDGFEDLYRAEQSLSAPVPLYSNLTRGRVSPQWSRSIEDNEGGLWFASTDSGLWYLPSNWRQFSVLTKDDRNPASLGNRQVYSIAPSASGDMWLAGSSGVLDRLDPETGKVQHVLVDAAGERVVNCVLEIADGAVWFGYMDGVARYRPDSGQLQRWGAEQATDAALQGDTFALEEDAAGHIWMASQNGELQVRDATGKVVDHIRTDNSRGLAPDFVIYELQRGPDGVIWLSGNHGLLAWDTAHRRFKPVPGVTAEEVSAFATAADGTVWLARPGVLEAYRHANVGLERFRRLDTRNGLPDLRFVGLSVDRHGILWASSVRGLIRINPEASAVRIYDIRDGLPGQEILSAPVPRRQDGRLVVSASHGLVIFDPAVVRPSTLQPRLLVDQVSVHSENGAQPLHGNAHFSIAHDTRDLRVVARLLSYHNVPGHRYRFRLSGFDSDWVDVGSNGERTFSRLEPGDYRLDIIGRSADNLWSQPQTLYFTVTPPWWRTWGATASFAVLALLLLWWISHAYHARLKRRSALQLAMHKREVAEQASLAKTRFLATLGHEVRTPMTGVLGMSELLLATRLDERQRGYTNAIQNAGSHLLRLVNDALDLARIEAGRLDLDIQDFDLRELVAGVVELYAPMAQKRGLQFQQHIADDAPTTLRGDPIRVRQILLNLLGNAIKFTDHGQVELQTMAGASGGVRFVIRDTGPGINAEQQKRLFRRFEQAEGRRTAARYGGSGLGLAISQELAVAMGGHVSLESSPGVGSLFVVELPLPSSQAPVSTPRRHALVPAPALRILLVEDDATVAEVIVGLLQAQGHQIVHASHGLSALRHAGNGHYDLAMLDLDLPGLDGIALARQLRLGGFRVPLLAITARSDAEAEQQVEDAGFEGFLRKPVTGEMLAAALQCTLQAGREKATQPEC